MDKLDDAGFKKLKRRDIGIKILLAIGLILFVAGSFALHSKNDIQHPVEVKGTTSTTTTVITNSSLSAPTTVSDIVRRKSGLGSTSITNGTVKNSTSSSINSTSTSTTPPIGCVPSESVPTVTTLPLTIPTTPRICVTR